MEQRRSQIVELVNSRGSISFAQLKEAFPSVSEMTLRTDLKALDQARRVVRVHGGVKSVAMRGPSSALPKRQPPCCALTAPFSWTRAVPPPPWPDACPTSRC